ncbi:PITH domain-containing protein [Iris pallida]|uniref:PITH domain-containing protein n=1 Tax=Iris pallida TaxID=29817 RepID=A0AAX6H4S8_IRIPA|nr:PITH domain-containing protein [Iris pallida]KAJ6836938.1 PITH domain-containing protein [Iris pallida]
MRRVKIDTPNPNRVFVWDSKETVTEKIRYFLPSPLSFFLSLQSPAMSFAASSVIQRGQVDLVDFIDWRSVECLNQNSGHAYANALKQGYREDDGLHLESDVDDQLLIYVPFTQVVKLYSVIMKGPEEEGPRTV